MKTEQSYKGKVVLAIGVHPDDIDFAASGTIAKMIKEGATAYHLLLTNGNKGSEDPKISKEKLAEIRRKEQITAAKILGFEKVFFLDHEDCNLVDDINLKEEIVYHIRKLKPDIVFCWDPTLIYSLRHNYIMHSDHRAAGQATLDAVYPLSRDRLTFQNLENYGVKPHKVKAVYMINIDEGDNFFDISETIDLKIKALKAHKSQVSARHIEMIKGWAKETGRKVNFKYAEAFKKIELLQ